MVNRQLERQQMNRERRMAEDEQFQKVTTIIQTRKFMLCIQFNLKRPG